MTKEQALFTFWNSFGYSAFQENSVPSSPENAPEFPYITFQFAAGSFDEQIPLTASIWDRKKPGYSAEDHNSKKAAEISKYIGRNGTFVPCDGGSVWIVRGEPFSQSGAEPNDDAVRRKVLNIVVQFMTAD